MANNIQVISYTEEYFDKWDKFVLQQSVNGTILQTRRFLSYHPADRFLDNSLMFMNGSNIVAVLPANVTIQDGRKVLHSHQGSTFGGIVIGRQHLKINVLEQVVTALKSYVLDEDFTEVYLKQTGNIFYTGNTKLIDYYLFKEGFSVSQEVGFYIEFNDYPDDIIQGFSSSRRRDYRYSLKHDLSFKELSDPADIKAFYEVLCDNYTKFDKTPVHTLEELLDFKENRMSKETAFYGVYEKDILVAGGMIFKFGQEVFHTQYLAVRQDKNNIFANEFLYKSLIQQAKDDGFRKISFGTSTFEGGKVLNKTLALYKEGFGTNAFINSTYSLKVIN